MPVRLERMEQQRETRALEEMIVILAEEFGLDPGDVRAELAAIERQIRHYGPTPAENRLQQLAAEFDLGVDELRDEVEQTRARLEARGVVW